MRPSPLLFSAVVLMVGAGTASAQSTVLRLAPEVGLVSKYRMSMEVFMEGAGVPFPAGTPFMQQEMLSTQTVTGIRGNARELVMVVDSMSLASPAMPGMIPQPDGIDGMRQHMVIDDRGRVVSVNVGDDTTDPDLRQVMEGINQGMSGLGFEFPEGPVAVGESWTANQEVNLPGGPGENMTLNSESTFTLLRIENVASARQAVLSLMSVMRGSADGMLGGMEGEANGEIVVDLTAGRMVSTIAKMTFNMSAPNGEMMTMTSRVELHLQN